MLVSNINTLKNIPGVRDIPFDPDLAGRVARDMREKGGAHGPGQRWKDEAVFGGDAKKAQSPEFSDMLDPWLGQKAARPVTPELFFAYRDFLDRRDYLGLLAAHFPGLEFREDSGLLAADLGSIMDVNLIASRLEKQEGERLRVLEIGGGYGRLAEVFLHLFPGQISYVMIDAVPASICYSYHYLKANLPQAKIGHYNLGHDFNIEEYDCYVIPSWRFEELNEYEYDLCLNIASIQEMEDDKAKYYIDLMNGVTRQDGLIYLSNSRDFYFQRDYYYPDNWKLLQSINTPRSWTPHSPVEIFIRASGDHKVGNAMIRAEYLAGVCAEYRREVNSLKGELADCRGRNDRLGQRLDQVKANYDQAAARRNEFRERLLRVNARPNWLKWLLTGKTHI